MRAQEITGASPVQGTRIDVVGDFVCAFTTTIPDGKPRRVEIKSTEPAKRHVRVDFEFYDRRGWALMTSDDKDGPFVEIGFTALEG